MEEERRWEGIGEKAEEGGVVWFRFEIGDTQQNGCMSCDPPLPSPFFLKKIKNKKKIAVLREPGRGVSADHLTGVKHSVIFFI